MKNSSLYLYFFIILFFNQLGHCQHLSKIRVKIDLNKHILYINQELTFNNQTNDTIKSIILNDWNNAYSSKSTPLSKRFSDEFVRSFYFSSNEDRGYTKINDFVDEKGSNVNFKRPESQPDLIEVIVSEPILPHQKRNFSINYEIKIPNEKFTGYGFSTNGKLNLRNWYLTPARYQNHQFVKYSNTNTEDITNAKSDFEVAIETNEPVKLESDLLITKTDDKNFKLADKNRLEFSLYVSKVSEFNSFKNDIVEITTNFRNNNINEIQKAIIIDKIVNFTNENLGTFSHQKMVVSQADYDKYPFYGLNQLPAFLSPFPNDFIFEIKFLKTYLNSFLKNTLNIDARNDNYIKDGIQVYLIMKYIEEFYPDSKMMGRLAKFKLIKGYNWASRGFNEQFDYLYMLTARENLDQRLGDSKDSFIKYNEQIALKYKSGLCFRYLDSYLDDATVENAIKTFYKLSLSKSTSRVDFENILKLNTNKNINWFFDNLINSNKTIDFKIKEVCKTKDSIRFTIKNKTQNNVPFQLFGLQKKAIIQQQWFSNVAKDTIITLPRNKIDRLVINYKNEALEYNKRNNFYKIEGFFPNNRPIKLVFMKDLEDPNFNQILYVPTITYNLYDGLTPGLSLHNKTLLDKPFEFNLEPSYATNSKSLTGFAYFVANQNVYNSRLYQISYVLSGSYFHYAINAGYTKFNPGIYFNFRDKDLRSNRKQLLFMRYIFVNREKLELATSLKEENYNILNFRFIDTKNELVKNIFYKQDFQISKYFGKISTEFQFRKLYQNNRQINLRFFAGVFLYNNTSSNYFNFALDRPTDYLFEHNYIGRSEETGLFSQQLIIAEGGFKSKLSTPFSDQFLITTNTSFNLWNWVEVYGDLGFLKNKKQQEKIVYGSGIKLNLVPDYFELYFPIHSNNGWEIGDRNYQQKIRFVVTLSPKILTNLVRRRWF